MRLIGPHVRDEVDEEVVLEEREQLLEHKGPSSGRLGGVIGRIFGSVFGLLLAVDAAKARGKPDACAQAGEHIGGFRAKSRLHVLLVAVSVQEEINKVGTHQRASGRVHGIKLYDRAEYAKVVKLIIGACQDEQHDGIPKWR